jgi:uncharacterized Zn finger protein
MSYFDGLEVTLPCENCGADIERKLGSLKTDPDVACDSCGHTNKVDNLTLNRDLKLVDEWIKNPWVNTQR